MIRKASSILLSMCMVAALFSCKDSAATQAWLESQAQEASKSLPMEIDTNKILDKMVAPEGMSFNMNLPYRMWINWRIGRTLKKAPKIVYLPY